jgi:hypothetical protein
MGKMINHVILVRFFIKRALLFKDLSITPGLFITKMHITVEDSTKKIKKAQYN